MIYQGLATVNIFVFSCQTSNCQLLVLASHIIHAFPMRVPHYMHVYVLLHN